MSDLISRKKVIDILKKEKSLMCGYDADIAIFSIEKGIRELPTAYSVGKVVAELEELKALKENSISKEAFEKMKSIAYKKGHRQGYNKAIDDFVCAVKRNFPTDKNGIFHIEQIAEQLKVGVENVQKK